MATLQFVEDEAQEKIDMMRETGTNPPAMLITGPPGTGKTHIWKTLGRRNKIAATWIRQTPTYLPEEIKGYGVPMADPRYGGQMVTRSTLPADFIPPQDVDEFILVLDDFNADTKMKQAILYRLIHEHEINGFKLPAKTLIAMTGNGVMDKAVATTIASTIISRTQYVRDVRPTFEHWANWATGNGIHEGVIAFFRDNPGDLYEGPREDAPWCCPRSIELMNRDLSWRLSNGRPWDQVMSPDRIATYIGEKTASKLAEYSRYEKVFRVVRRIVAGDIDPDDKEVLKLEPDERYVLGIGVATRMELEPGYKWLIGWGRTKGAKETAYYAIRTLGKARDEGGHVLRKFGDQLIQIFGDEFRMEMGIKG